MLLLAKELLSHHGKIEQSGLMDQTYNTIDWQTLIDVRVIDSEEVNSPQNISHQPQFF